MTEGTPCRVPVNEKGAAEPEMVILFDGRCPLCVGAVRWVLYRDRHRRFMFASIDSPAASDLLTDCQADSSVQAAVRSGETVALVHGTRLYTRSEAAVRILAKLPFPWNTLSLVRAVPRVFRDGLYSACAARRHRVRGPLESCYVPGPEERRRFL